MTTKLNPCGCGGDGEFEEHGSHCLLIVNHKMGCIYYDTNAEMYCENTKESRHRVTTEWNTAHPMSINLDLVEEVLRYAIPAILALKRKDVEEVDCHIKDLIAAIRERQKAGM